MLVEKAASPHSNFFRAFGAEKIGDNKQLLFQLTFGRDATVKCLVVSTVNDLTVNSEQS